MEILCDRGLYINWAFKKKIKKKKKKRMWLLLTRFRGILIYSLDRKLNGQGRSELSFALSCRLTNATFKISVIKTYECYVQQKGVMVAVPVDTSLRAVMITTAKTKVARAVKREATAMADTIKNNG